MAFEDMDTKHRAKGVGTGKSISMGPARLVEGFEQEEWLPAGGWLHVWVMVLGYLSVLSLSLSTLKVPAERWEEQQWPLSGAVPTVLCSQ